MPCELHPMPGGGHAIICTGGRRARCQCGKPAPLLCDWKVPGRRSGTCDRPICNTCTTSPAPGKDLCPEHAAAFAKWQEGRLTS